MINAGIVTGCCLILVGLYLIQRTGETLRTGLCARKGDHTPHRHESTSLGVYWCSGEEDDREPGRSERRRALLGRK